jgi:hypothetical protein
MHVDLLLILIIYFNEQIHNLYLDNTIHHYFLCIYKDA